MNLRIRGAWNQIKGRIRQGSARVTGDSSEYGKGQGERIVGKVESQLGKAKDRASKF